MIRAGSWDQAASWCQSSIPVSVTCWAMSAGVLFVFWLGIRNRSNAWSWVTLCWDSRLPTAVSILRFDSSAWCRCLTCSRVAAAVAPVRGQRHGHHDVPVAEGVGVLGVPVQPPKRRGGPGVR